MSSVADSASSAMPTAPIKAPPQAGILDGVNPVHFDEDHPIILFIIQASIIIIFCRLLNYPFSKLRQPRVISEIMGGIILGPSVMGRIPGFQASIFPPESMTNLNLVANLGLTLFLFIIGLEVDLRFLLSNWKVALNVGLASMAVPFGLGCAIAVGLYREFSDEPDTVPIEFPVYMLFIGVAMAITAFPVLCRILTELKLLMTPVGIIVLSAGVGNDVVGWILLALCVALVNAGSGLTALWVLLTCAGYMLFLVYLVRPAFIYTLRRCRALQDGPSQGIISLTLLLALGSAFFTAIIGVHPIFGAFMAGLICPHEGGFAFKVAEKIEDLIGALFLPLYFTLSGLNTNIGLLDSGIVWAYVVGVVAVAFFSKFISAALAARSSKMLWRECFAVGSLMSCKGLVELIVLNIGLDAKILSVRTFTIFVVMALVTTFASAPLTAYFYPLWYQKKVECWRAGEIDWHTGKPVDGSESTRNSSVHYEKITAEKIKQMTVYLRLDSLPNLLAFTALFGGRNADTPPAPKTHPSKATTSTSTSTNTSRETTANSLTPPSDSTTTPTHRPPVQVHALRLLPLTDRGSSVMQVSDLESHTAYDPIINTFRTFGRLHNLAVSGSVLVVPESTFAETIAMRAQDSESDLLVLPWSEMGGMSEWGVGIEEEGGREGTRDKLLATDAYTAFVHDALGQARVPVAVLVTRNQHGGNSKNNEPRQSGGIRLARTHNTTTVSSAGAARDKPVTIAPIADRSQHIFFPFLGGRDDTTALSLVLQLAENPHVTATVVYFDTRETSASKTGGVVTTTTNDASREQAAATALFTCFRTTLPPDLANRVVFETVVVDTSSSSSPLQDVLARASMEVGQSSARNAGGDLIVLGRRHVARNQGFVVGGEDDADEIRSSRSSAVAGTLGVLAEKVWEAKLRASVLVVQAAGR
ncbi:hypothetical protein BDW02DRAFT_556043 [Decorospora gaudefroyi]|uniref:Cation/H+ exchanger transmembrane domain-containing protein n=1 Tax=Decorospora gaudefroyi TaxID=184978 RepID=A0A6A5K5C6_9PLEO|nr:hypothetical protein BDW02DRAFT_556043 [Decorospora gaudefroyi]